jgi:hypothetical protein
VPPDSVHETQDVIKGKIDELGQAYQALDPAIKAREMDPADVIDHLRDLQNRYMRRGVITDQAAHSAIESEIKKVQAIAMKNTPVSQGMANRTTQFQGAPKPAGKVTVDDIIHMKQNANGRTNFNSPDADKSLWRGIGDAYRSAADIIAPEVTPLNRDYQKYKDLEQIIEQNIARGKGTTQSGLSALLTKASQHGAGAAAGGALGSVAGPIGAAAGSVAGGIIGPKLGKAASQAIQNAVDAGLFQGLAPAKQQAIRAASAIGDNSTVLRLLGTSAIEQGAAAK